MSINEDDELRDEITALTEKLAEFRDWPCENDGCEHTLGDVMAHDANHPKPTSGGTWFCAACWNRALGGLKAKLAEVTAADRATRIALVEVETALLEAETALAASQAHVVELRAAGKELEELLDTADLPNGASLRRLRTAVARESSTDALLEFGVRCIQLWDFGVADGDVPDDLKASMEQTALAALERR